MTGWRAAVPEVVIAVVAVAALCGGLYALAGTGAAAAAATAAGAAAVVVLRGFLPADEVLADYEAADDVHGQTTFTGFWRTQRHVRAATRQLAGYDYELRATLQHLLAARLADRHGISLYDDPEAARKLVGGQLWPWLDPGRDGPPASDLGIPPRTLAAIIDRLERL